MRTVSFFSTTNIKLETILSKQPMNTASPTRSVSLNAVMNYTHPGLVERLQDKLNLPHEDAQLLFDDTKRFLYLCAISDSPIAPPEMVDEGWHNFILYTADYTQFCQRFFGRMINHFPKTRAEKAASDGGIVRRTKLLLQDVFGSQLSKFWQFKGETRNCSDGESCAGSTNCQGD